MNHLKPQLPPKFELFFLFEDELETFLESSFILEQRGRSSPFPKVSKTISILLWSSGEVRAAHQPLGQTHPVSFST